MIIKKYYIGIVMLSIGFQTQAQNEIQQDFVKSCFDLALNESHAYEDLRYLCKNIGSRLSGSKGLEEAVEWSEGELNTIGATKIYKQDVSVPHWERGTENAYFYSVKGRQKVKITALGGSVGTGNYKISGKVIEFNSIQELIDSDSNDVKGKIAFINQPFEESKINTFHAYGSCASARFNGAVEAAKKGALSVLVRSLSNSNDNFPHTGVMGYKAGVDSIPGVALSIESANILSEILELDSTLDFTMKVGSKFHKNALSHNVIAEVIGSTYPDDIMTVGAHLDSWDLGEGAHDDGAGVVQVMEVLRIFNALEYKPKHTLRFVLFTNEENGAEGAKRYAEIARSNSENHILALESDRGGFSPRGFSIDSKDESLKTKIRSWKPFLENYGLHDFQDGYGGVDIAPLRSVNENISLLGLNPDSQRYFTHHHAKNDVFESVNRRELELGAASMAGIIYLLDQNIK